MDGYQSTRKIEKEVTEQQERAVVLRHRMVEREKQKKGAAAAEGAMS